MMQPIIIQIAYYGYRFIHKMAGKPSARIKDNLNLTKTHKISNPCSRAFYRKVQDLSSIKHSVCNLKTNADDCLIQFSNERTTTFSKTNPHRCKYNFKSTFDVSMIDALKDICTLDFNKCANTRVTFDYVYMTELRSNFQCYLRNDFNIFDYIEENIENRTDNLHKNSLIFILSNLQKCIDRLQFTQNHGQICFQEDDISKLSQKGINGNIAKCISVIYANSGIASCIPGPGAKRDIASCFPMREANRGVATCVPKTEANSVIVTYIPGTSANIAVETCIQEPDTNSDIATCIPIPGANSDIATCNPKPGPNNDIATCIPIPGANSDIATCIPIPGANSDIATCNPIPGANSDIATCIPIPGANSDIATCIPIPGANSDIATCNPIPGANSNIATCIPIQSANSDIATCIPIPGANGDIAMCLPDTDQNNGITISVIDANSTVFSIQSNEKKSQPVPPKSETNDNCSDTSYTHNKQCMKANTELQSNFSEIGDTVTGNIVKETRLSNSVSSEILELETRLIVLDDTELNSESCNAYNKETGENFQGQGLLIISDNSKNSNIETEGLGKTHLNYDIYELDTRTSMHEKTKLHGGILVSQSNYYVKSVVEQYFTSFNEPRTHYDHEFGSKKEKGWYSDFKQEILLYPIYKHSLENSFNWLLNGESGVSTRLMCYEFHRLNSFSDFSNEWSPSLIKLAGNGWYSTGNGREAKCFSCGVYYGRWNYDSDPVKIHRELSPYCSMVNGLDGDNVPISKENRTEETATNRYDADRNGENQSPEHAPVQKQISSDQKNMEIENSSIPSVDQLSLSDDFQNLGLHDQPAGGHCFEYNNPKTNVGTILNGLSSGNSEESASLSIQNVEVGQINNGYISCGPDGACTEYVNGTVVNKMNGMNKNEQIHTRQGADAKDQADNLHQCTGKPLLWANSENYLPKKKEDRDTEAKEKQIYRLPSVEISSPKYPKYRSLAVRISSFRGWPSYLNQSERDLALAGFFYKGYLDEVTCYQCGMTLANWQENDDGFVEHAKWKPSCYFVRKFKGDAFVRLVQAAQNQIEIQPSVIENVRREHPGKNNYNGHAEYPALLHKTTAKQNQRSSSRDTLIAMGFTEKEVDVAIDSIYARSDDIEINLNELLEVLCERQTTCSESERDVSSSSLPTSLATNTSFNASSIESSCLSGDGPISSFVHSFEHEHHTQETQNHLDITADQLDHKSDTSRPRPEIEADSRKSIECKICLDEEVGMIFTPCGHICACVTCSQNLSRCPVCRKHIVKKIRGYLS